MHGPVNVKFCCDVYSKITSRTM